MSRYNRSWTSTTICSRHTPISHRAFTYTVPVLPDLITGLEQHERGYGSRGRRTAAPKSLSAGAYQHGSREERYPTRYPGRVREDFAEAVAKHRATLQDALSPAERGEKFAVPRLMVEVQGTLEFADTDALMENHDWSLGDHPWRPGEDEFAIRETARRFEIDLDGVRVAYQFTAEEQQFALDVDVEGWTPEALVLWLDRQVRQPDIGQGDLVGWLSRVVNHLVVSRGLRVAALMRCKFILARKVKEKIAAIRGKERDGVYQRHLFAAGAKPEISFNHAFSFEDGMYRDLRRYRGRWKPSKHFLGAGHVPAFDGAEDGEELDLCRDYRQPTRSKVLDQECREGPGVILAAYIGRQILPGFRSAAGRRPAIGRGIQGCSYCRGSRHC